MPAKRTLEAEVTRVSKDAVWVLVGSEELSIPFDKFPWFKNARIEQILAVERTAEHHLYWPQLDIDLSVDSLRDPDAYPLVSKAVA